MEERLHPKIRAALTNHPSRDGKLDSNQINSQKVGLDSAGLAPPYVYGASSNFRVGVEENTMSVADLDFHATAEREALLR